MGEFANFLKRASDEVRDFVENLPLFFTGEDADLTHCEAREYFARTKALAIAALCHENIDKQKADLCVLLAIFPNRLLGPEFGQESLLHHVVKTVTVPTKCRPDLVDFLIKEGANVNARNESGLTPLEAMLEALKNCYGQESPAPHGLADKVAAITHSLVAAGADMLGKNQGSSYALNYVANPAPDCGINRQTCNLVQAAHVLHIKMRMILCPPGMRQKLAQALFQKGRSGLTLRAERRLRQKQKAVMKVAAAVPHGLSLLAAAENPMVLAGHLRRYTPGWFVKAGIIGSTRQISWMSYPDAILRRAVMPEGHVLS